MERVLKSSLLHVAFGFLAMGGWALFANRAHGLAEAWPPALVQGTISGILTGALKKTLETLDGRLAGWLAFVVPPALTAASILALLTLAHSLVGTPEMVATIAVPWSVSTLYAVLYNAGLVRARGRAA
jgi:hypothetical protein